jgi:hypothetical protein
LTPATAISSRAAMLNAAAAVQCINPAGSGMVP